MGGTVQHTHGPQTRGSQTRTHSGATGRGGRKTAGARVTPGGVGGETTWTRVRVDEGGWETLASTHLWSLPTLLLSLIRAYTTEVMPQTWQKYSFDVRVWKTNLGALDSPGWHNHSVPLLYHVRTFYIVRYSSPTTHPSHPTYTINELQKRKTKRNNGGF